MRFNNPYLNGRLHPGAALGEPAAVRGGGRRAGGDQRRARAAVLRRAAPGHGAPACQPAARPPGQGRQRCAPASIAELVDYSGCESYGTSGFGRQKSPRKALVRGTNPKLSRRTCTCEYGLPSRGAKSAGFAKRPRERSPTRNPSRHDSQLFSPLCVPQKL